MKNISLMANVLAQTRENNVIIILDMIQSELYTIDGDAGLMVDYINRNASLQNVTDIALKEFLLENSKDFKKNPEQDKTISEALKHLQKIKLITYET